jgi:hypothetical protein
VQQLIALATDPAASEEEARTAALQAARGIRQHDLAVVTRDEARGAQAAYAGPVTGRGRQLGQGTPRLPSGPVREAPRRALGPAPRDETGYGARGAAHVVELDFKDDSPNEKLDQAFPAALLALLGK